MEATRLNKFIAHSGVCSRRKAGELVKEGKIKVNGAVETNPAIEVVATDKVVYLGKRLRIQHNMVYVLMNKPKNVVTTTADEKARTTVMDIVDGKIKERIYPVGRLDRNTTGLLLLTNDGDLAKKLSHPSHKVKKQYHVILDKVVTEEHMEKIKTGLILEDGPVPVDDVDWIIGSDRTEVGIEVHIGRNRIVRRIFESMGYVVLKLDRVHYAGLTKKDLPRGWFRELKPKEVIMLKHFTEGKTSIAKKIKSSDTSPEKSKSYKAKSKNSASYDSKPEKSKSYGKNSGPKSKGAKPTKSKSYKSYFSDSKKRKPKSGGKKG